MALDSLLGGALNIIPQLFYLLSMALLSIIDVFQLLFRKLAGLDTYYVDGSAQTGDIISDFLGGILFGGYPVLSSVFLGLIILGVILLFLSTIVAIIRNEYTTEKAENSKSKIIGKAFKSIIYFAIIPVVCIFGVYLANIVLMAVDSATSHNTYYAQTLDRNKLKPVTINNQSLPGLPNAASSAQKTYITYNMFGRTNDKGEPYGTTNTPFSGTIFKAAAYWANRVRNSENLTPEEKNDGKIDYAQLIKTGGYTNFNGLFSDPSGNTEAIAIKIDIAFGDNVVFADDTISTLDLSNEAVADVNQHKWNPLAENPAGKKYTFANRYDIELVWYYYDLWSFNFVIALGASIVMVTIFISIIFGLMRRLIELVGLFLIAPPLIALMPLDNEKAYGEWRKSFISKTLMAYGAIGGMNIVMLILPELQRITFFNDVALDLIANTLLILVALLTVKSFIEVVSKLVGGDDAVKSGGDIAKDAGELAAKGLKVAATTGGLALAGAKLAGKAGLKVAGTAGAVVGGSIAKAKMKFQGGNAEWSEYQSDKKRFALREQHHAEAKERTYKSYRTANIDSVDADLQRNAAMRQLKANDGAGYQKVLEEKTRERFEGLVATAGHPINTAIEAAYNHLQANTKMTNAEYYAGTRMASWGRKVGEFTKDYSEMRPGLGGLDALIGKYGRKAGGYVKENAVNLGKPLVHSGKLVLQTYGDILLDNQFAKGFRDGDTLEDAQLRLFQGITKKEADKAKDKANKEKDNVALVTLQRDAFKAAFKEALEESKNK